MEQKERSHQDARDDSALVFLFSISFLQYWKIRAGNSSLNSSFMWGRRAALSNFLPFNKFGMATARVQGAGEQGAASCLPLDTGWQIPCGDSQSFPGLQEKSVMCRKETSALF